MKIRLEELLNLNHELITLEKLEEIEASEFVEGAEDNGMSGSDYYYNKHWYSIFFKKEYIDENCDNAKEIQVYID
jgi:hypothetical protein